MNWCRRGSNYGRARSDGCEAGRSAEISFDNRLRGNKIVGHVPRNSMNELRCGGGRPNTFVNRLGSFRCGVSGAFSFTHLDKTRRNTKREQIKTSGWCAIVRPSVARMLADDNSDYLPLPTGIRISFPDTEEGNKEAIYEALVGSLPSYHVKSRVDECLGKKSVKLNRGGTKYEYFWVWTQPKVGEPLGWSRNGAQGGKKRDV
ncbi:hypothetical protein OUZ56_028655 [Daphnia magna]|uniref:Uncharacterized protein n=1 Tax=Daphnia magna TaxID=35525 RepID=A0ABR0B4H6_9CRUS|nr:hypothetical protein OUZ56_028655 [Daphnia magna]